MREIEIPSSCSRRWQIPREHDERIVGDATASDRVLLLLAPGEAAELIDAVIAKAKRHAMEQLLVDREEDVRLHVVRRSHST
jgi:hypothetical protein